MVGDGEQRGQACVDTADGNVRTGYNNQMQLQHFSLGIGMPAAPNKRRGGEYLSCDPKARKNREERGSNAQNKLVEVNAPNVPSNWRNRRDL